MIFQIKSHIWCRRQHFLWSINAVSMPMQFIVLPKNQKCIGCHDLSKFAYFILFDEYTDSRVGYFTAKREFHIIPENSRNNLRPKSSRASSQYRCKNYKILLIAKRHIAISIHSSIHSKQNKAETTHLIFIQVSKYCSMKQLMIYSICNVHPHTRWKFSIQQRIKRKILVSFSNRS